MNSDSRKNIVDRKSKLDLPTDFAAPRFSCMYCVSWENVPDKNKVLKIKRKL